MKISVVDIGSNTIKMKLFEYENGILEPFLFEVRNSMLISYVENGIMSEKGIQTLVSCILEFAEIAEKNGALPLNLFATASLRKADNYLEVVEKVRKQTAFDIDVICGEKEAEYSFCGVMSEDRFVKPQGLMIDMGGGSTECVYYEKRTPISKTSMPFGSLSLYNSFAGNSVISRNGYEKIFAYAGSMYGANVNRKTDFAVIAGGTGLAIKKIYKKLFRSNAALMDMGHLTLFYEKIITNDKTTSDLIDMTIPERKFTVRAGLAAYMGLFSEAGIETVYASTTGVREGYVYKKILGEKK